MFHPDPVFVGFIIRNNFNNYLISNIDVLITPLYNISSSTSDNDVFYHQMFFSVKRFPEDGYYSY